MEKENKLKCILIDFEQGEITLSEASNTILRLFSVSEPLKCSRCKKTVRSKIVLDCYGRCGNCTQAF